MSNPAIPQGSLNRLQASVFYGANPLLNVIAAFLTPDGIDIALEGEVSQLIPTMIGAVPSPEPSQFIWSGRRVWRRSTKTRLKPTAMWVP